MTDGCTLQHLTPRVIWRVLGYVTKSFGNIKQLLGFIFFSGYSVFEKLSVVSETSNKYVVHYVFQLGVLRNWPF